MLNKDRHHWEPHLPRMVELYKSRISIPEIHRTLKLEDKSFNVSEKQLYNKFNSLHLPTDKKNGDRASTIQALEKGLWKSSINGINGFGNPVVSGSLWKTEDVYFQSFDAQPSITGKALAVRPSPLRNEHNSAPSFSSASEMNGFRKDHHSDYAQAHPANNRGIFPDFSLDTYGSSTFFGEHDRSFEESHGNMTFYDDSTTEVEHQAVNPFNNDISVPPLQWQPYSGTNNANRQMAPVTTGHKRQTSGNNLMPTSERQKVGSSLSTVAPIPEDYVLSSNKSTHQPSVKKCFRKRADESIERKHAAAQLKGTNSATPDKRLSSSTSSSWRDSGYGSSGRSTPMFARVEDFPSISDSLAEFGGLHRIPCQLHEPESTDRFKDYPACTDCHMSGIHFLCWSAKDLSLEAFETKLTSYSRIEVRAIDAAGNSALHYAATGGAGPEHFLALKDVGADIWALNTAGQLFLNCWQPSTSFKTMSEASFELFKVNLVDLLNMFDTNGGLRWRDNEGRTVKLDAVVLQIRDNLMREKTLDIVNTIGYPFLFSHQLPGLAMNVQLPTEQYSTSGGSSNGPRTTPSRQDKAWEIIRHAAHNPCYVDLSSGNNALHALAQVKLPGKVPGKGSLQPRIKECVEADTDLNLLNHDKESPLIAMIRDRPLMEQPFMDIETDETGATMSRYIDTLLWKDVQKKIPNRINVNLKNREGATALYYAAILARPDSVRSLIEAGANVNICLFIDGDKISILKATRRAKMNLQLKPWNEKQKLKLHMYDEVVSYLEHHGALDDPTPAEERALSAFSITTMPI